MFRTKFRHIIGATMVAAIAFGSVGVAYSVISPHQVVQFEC